jgi:hypothetical protein
MPNPIILFQFCYSLTHGELGHKKCCGHQGQIMVFTNVFKYY